MLVTCGDKTLPGIFLDIKVKSVLAHTITIIFFPYSNNMIIPQNCKYDYDHSSESIPILWYLQLVVDNKAIQFEVKS